MDNNERAARIRVMLQPKPWSAWFDGKDLTEDWSSGNFPLWMKVLAPSRDKALSILEVGSFEGRPAIFWLEFLPNSTLTCVDHFATTKKRDGGDIERRFDANTNVYANRLTKIKNSSASALSRMADEKRRFDLIYIDGCHYRDEVLVDSLLAWQLLEEGGLIIFDDYEHQLERDPAQRPKDAIDCFMGLHVDEITEVSRGYQLIIRKTRE